MKTYNIVCDTQKEKYNLLTLFHDNNINVANVSGYCDGYIIHVEIVNDEQLQNINTKINALCA